MQLSGLGDAIALIQVIQGSYADAGVDIQPRIEAWVERAIGVDLAGRKLTRVGEITDEVAIGLASALWKAFEAERSTLRIPSASVQRFLAAQKLSILDWRRLAAEVSPDEVEMLLAIYTDPVVRRELLAIAGVGGGCVNVA